MAVDILCKKLVEPSNFSYILYFKRSKLLEGFSKSVFQSTKVIINCGFALRVIAKALYY